MKMESEFEEGKESCQSWVNVYLVYSHTYNGVIFQTRIEGEYLWTFHGYIDLMSIKDQRRRERERGEDESRK